MCDGHGRQGQAVLHLALHGHQLTLLHEHHATAAAAVRGDTGVVGIACKVDDLPGALVAHGGHQGVGRIEHRITAGCHVLNDHLLDPGNALHRVDVVQTQMVTGAHVGDHGHRTAVEAQTFTQDAATRALQHGGLHVGVGQHVARALGAAAIAAVGLPRADIHTVGVGHAHTQALRRQHMGDHARGGGLAVDAGDGHQRDTAILTGGIQLGDDGVADVAPLAIGGVEVHPQARRCVDLHDAARLVFQGALHGFADHVHTAHVQAHHARCVDRTGRHLRVHVIGHVGGAAPGGQVGVVAQNDAAAFFGHRLGREVLLHQARLGNVVKADLGQGRGVAGAAAGVGVHQVHQLAHGVLAIANHMRRVTAGGGHQSVAHHQEPEVAARQKLFDQHAANGGSRGKGRVELLSAADVDRHAAALAAVLGLDHHWQADALGNGPGLIGVGRRCTDGHGHGCRLQQALGEVLVLRDGFGHGARVVDLGGLDAPLLVAPAELHQAASGQAPVGHAAGHGGRDDGARAGAQAQVFVKLAQLSGTRHTIQASGLCRGLVGRPGSLQDRLHHLQGAAGHRLFRVLHHHQVHPVLGRAFGMAEGDRATCSGLQGQQRGLQGMCQGDGAAPRGRAQRAQAGAQGTQAVFEPAARVDRTLLGRAAHLQLKGGVAAPKVRASQGPGADHVHGNGRGSGVWKVGGASAWAGGGSVAVRRPFRPTRTGRGAALAGAAQRSPGRPR